MEGYIEYNVPEVPSNPDLINEEDNDLRQMKLLAEYIRGDVLTWQVSNFVFSQLDKDGIWDIKGTSVPDKIIMSGRPVQLQYDQNGRCRKEYEVKLVMAIPWLKNGDTHKVIIDGISHNNNVILRCIKNVDGMAASLINIFNPPVLNQTKLLPMAMQFRIIKHKLDIHRDLIQKKYS